VRELHADLDALALFAYQAQTESEPALRQPARPMPAGSHPTLFEIATRLEEAGAALAGVLSGVSIAIDQQHPAELLAVLRDRLRTS